MKPNDIRAELIRKGVALADIGRMCDASRQTVWFAIRSKGERGKCARVRKKISEIIGKNL